MTDVRLKQRLDRYFNQKVQIRGPRKKEAIDIWEPVVRQILQHVKTNDGRFDFGPPLYGGSFYERTKTKAPNEFDVMLEIPSLSRSRESSDAGSTDEPSQAAGGLFSNFLGDLALGAAVGVAVGATVGAAVGVAVGATVGATVAAWDFSRTSRRPAELPNGRDDETDQLELPYGGNAVPTSYGRYDAPSTQQGWYDAPTGQYLANEPMSHPYICLGERSYITLGVKLSDLKFFPHQMEVFEITIELASLYTAGPLCHH